ncbi:MAG: methylenetetrahydrofolate--tRNA-(uracil(54)-C(5))-methyltransferase (FADH(2)-oxidizing) TrmFO [Zetaproteobacteria bacterium]|nr:MAG: methylenetetrahydrofolate--tRNA-(uracil(54)-C(5))-methyltransferase (FADH(2)-oxidizing) TrmFO [Zetaproteobacteria bacterium]
MEVIVIGAGLAGSEAAWQLARRGVRVRLVEMRPKKLTPAHRTGNFAELVCSNTLRSDALDTATGLLHEEMRRLDSLVIRSADAHRVPAGTALAVDRHKFSEAITEALSNHPNIIIERREITEIPNEGWVLIATGPLTSDPLARAIQRLTGEQYLSFYDAISPIIDAETVDYGIAYWKNRYDKGGTGADYLNCPMTKAEYEAFIDALLSAEMVEPKPFEDVRYFEGCMPIEEIARRGRDAPRFGPMRPVGLEDPRTGKLPYAVVQLRKENAEGTLLNMVGFQTKLKYPEQKRVFRMIPGLEQAEFLRFGSVHRNTFICSPKLLLATLQLKSEPRVLFAGQITGVEGYVESAATGLIAGLMLAALVRGESPTPPPPETAHGALIRYITTADPKHFQPMNINFGLLPPAPRALEGRRLSRTERRRWQVERALASLEAWKRAAS